MELMKDQLVVAAPPGETGSSGLPQEQSTWKIIVVGNMNTGKTSIIKRYCDGHFMEYNKPSTGETEFQVCSVSVELYSKIVSDNAEEVRLAIWVHNILICTS